MYERLALLVCHLICLCFVVYLRPKDTERLYMRKRSPSDYVRTVFEVLTICRLAASWCGNAA